jgi:nicotinamidase-related amidase
MSTPRRALVLVDVQQEYFDGPLEVQYPPRAGSLAKITEAIDVANAAGIPVVVVQHALGEGAPVFDPTTQGYQLHPQIEQRRTSGWMSITKQFGTVFAGTDLLGWVHQNDIDTVTFVGYMTNNCILASAAQSETHGLVAEVLSDATGAIHIANSAGSVSAEAVHTTLMTILHSNFAAVGTTEAWADAVTAGAPLEKDNLVGSAMLGAQHAG